jgi:hypothetical protein
MTFDQALELVDTIAHIARLEIESSALDADHWERREDIAHTLHERRYRAAAILATPKLAARDDARKAAALAPLAGLPDADFPMKRGF